jgi:diguanylate cyclase (GGDEF)-like protein
MSTLEAPQSRRATDQRKFRPVVFLLATAIAAAVLLSIVAIPQHLSKQARWEVLRMHVGQIGQLAVSAVNGDLHRRLLDPSNYTPELYATALEPLVRFHSANSDLFYVYTMTVRDNVPRFVLDTAASGDLRTKHQLRASGYMQPFELRKEYEDGWIEEIADGKTYVNPTYQHDDYGYFLTAHVPIYDSQHRYSGFVGVDFDMNYYLAEEARFGVIEGGSLVAAALVALLIGYLVTLHYGDLQQRLRNLYRHAHHDELTGLLNRRGAREAVNTALLRHAANRAMLLIGIDQLKMIVAAHGHTAADAAVANVADAVRRGAGEKNICARVGEDAFMIFADCDVPRAIDTAERVLARLNRGEPELAGVKVSVSVGIAAHDGTDTDFSRMYRDADSALCEARVEGNGYSVMFTTTAADRKPASVVSGYTSHDVTV